MPIQRKQHSNELKAKVVLEAIRGMKTANELASEQGVHPTQIAAWKKLLLERSPELFASAGGEKNKSEEGLIDTLYQQIGQLKVELDFVKKKLNGFPEVKGAWIEPNHPQISISRQCELLKLARSSYYYQPVGVSEQDLLLMRLLDEQQTRTPFYGTRKMTAWLHTRGYEVNRKRVTRLLRLMGLEAIYPKARLSQGGAVSQKYPYLLRGVSIDRTDYVWSSAITYMRLAKGFVYLVAILDWFSRYVLAWELSVTLDTSFCLNALEQAFRAGPPAIFNTDQGVQFTSQEYIQRLKEAHVRISWDGRGRALDNIFVERLWRSVKYEEVYVRTVQLKLIKK